MIPPSPQKRKMLRRLFLPLLDFVLPPTCPACDAPQISVNGSDGTGALTPLLCTRCFDGLEPHQGPQCGQCASPVDALFSRHDLRCGTCLADPPAFTSVQAPLVYTGTTRDLILGLKHGGRRANARLLAGYMQACLPHFDNRPEKKWLLVPIPLHIQRLRARGFNQSMDLARALLQGLNSPHGYQLAAHALTRLKATPSQGRLSATARARNVRGAFGVPDPSQVRGQSILLIDDVMTSGATLRTAAKKLKQAGAREVRGLAAARALPT